MKLVQWLLDLVYPPKCVFCGRLLQRTETELCRNCRTTLPEVERPITRGEFFEACQSVYYYDGAVVDSIHRFKFSGMEHYATTYGRLIAMALLKNEIKFDCLTWVPVSAKRRKKRGYDQAQCIAQVVAGELGCQCIQTLEKIRDNPAQSTRTDAAARRGNVLNVYRPVHPEIFREKRVLLIDDVITTGATLSECSRVLKTAGAAQIYCATLAATINSDKKNSR